jgi:hypothetical protein
MCIYTEKLFGLFRSLPHGVDISPIERSGLPEGFLFRLQRIDTINRSFQKALHFGGSDYDSHGVNVFSGH